MNVRFSGDFMITPRFLHARGQQRTAEIYNMVAGKIGTVFPAFPIIHSSLPDTVRLEYDTCVKNVRKPGGLIGLVSGVLVEQPTDKDRIIVKDKQDDGYWQDRFEVTRRANEDDKAFITRAAEEARLTSPVKGA